MKMLQLLPDQIMHFWEHIKICILQSMPPYVEMVPEALLHVQEQLLVGKMQAWAALDEAKADEVYGLLVTKIVLDDCTLTRNLLVFALVVKDGHPESIWQEGYEAVGRFAAAKGCYKIIAYSSNPAVIRIVQRLGGFTGCAFISLDVKR